MKRSTVVTVVFAASALFVFGVSGCKSSKKDTPAQGSQGQPAAHMGMDMSQGNSLSGKVVETMNSGGYTYVSLEKNGKKTWVAVPETKVKVGQEVSCQPGMEMKNFTSKTLNRTFDSIFFSGGVI